VIEFKEEDVKKGKVTFYADYFDEIGINIGDVVAFNPKFGYKFKIDEKDYLRIRLIDLLYVETN
jgi:co-chaperonin GroES (HSP10)